MHSTETFTSVRYSPWNHTYTRRNKHYIYHFFSFHFISIARYLFLSTFLFVSLLACLFAFALCFYIFLFIFISLLVSFVDVFSYTILWHIVRIMIIVVQCVPLSSSWLLEDNQCDFNHYSKTNKLFIRLKNYESSFNWEWIFHIKW